MMHGQTNINFSLFFKIYNVFKLVDSANSVSVTTQNETRGEMKFFSHNYETYHLPKCSSFLFNHSVQSRSRNGLITYPLLFYYFVRLLVYFPGVTTHYVCIFTARLRALASSFSRGFLITHNDAPQSVGLLWTSDQLVAETSTLQHTTLATDRHL
jgi:hypothetical protein